ncbi:hypothetical protein OS189_02465 [Sulfitobacter sp. F26169L]|nr:hypothetical protein [Sulfitobacter sp. F26169L]
MMMILFTALAAISLAAVAHIASTPKKQPALAPKHSARPNRSAKP